jgi:hypothetical protein
MRDLRTALHHLCQVVGSYRGTAQMYESTTDEFTVVCDFPESQLTIRGPDAVVPFLRECRTRLMTTNPDAIVEARDYQPLTITGGPGNAPQTIHRVFVRVKSGEYE